MAVVAIQACYNRLSKDDLSNLWTRFVWPGFNRGQVERVVFHLCNRFNYSTQRTPGEINERPMTNFVGIARNENCFIL